jgi:hypothetical protein
VVDNTASLRLESIVPSVHWLQSATEVETWRSRHKQLAHECRARAKAALGDGNCGLRRSGHSVAVFNGTYEAVDERDGWPVLRNEHSVWLYRPSHRGETTSNSWTLSKEHTPDTTACEVYIDAPDGSFPVGEQTWQVWNFRSRLWEGGVLRMRVVVRVWLVLATMLVSLARALCPAN